VQEKKQISRHIMLVFIGTSGIIRIPVECNVGEND
jgi:hypothetical protein